MPSSHRLRGRGGSCLYAQPRGGMRSCKCSRSQAGFGSECCLKRTIIHLPRVNSHQQVGLLEGTLSEQPNAVFPLLMGPCPSWPLESPAWLRERCGSPRGCPWCPGGGGRAWRVLSHPACGWSRKDGRAVLLEATLVAAKERRGEAVRGREVASAARRSPGLRKWGGRRRGAPAPPRLHNSSVAA